MAGTRKIDNSNTISFKIGTTQYRILTGQNRDFLSAKAKDGGWAILDDASTAAVVARLSDTVNRLTPST